MPVFPPNRIVRSFPRGLATRRCGHVRSPSASSAGCWSRPASRGLRSPVGEPIYTADFRNGRTACARPGRPRPRMRGLLLVQRLDSRSGPAGAARRPQRAAGLRSSRRSRPAAGRRTPREHDVDDTTISRRARVDAYARQQQNDRRRQQPTTGLDGEPFPVIMHALNRSWLDGSMAGRSARGIGQVRLPVSGRHRPARRAAAHRDLAERRRPTPEQATPGGHARGRTVPAAAPAAPEPPAAACRAGCRRPAAWSWRLLLRGRRCLPRYRVAGVYARGAAVRGRAAAHRAAPATAGRLRRFGLPPSPPPGARCCLRWPSWPAGTLAPYGPADYPHLERARHTVRQLQTCMAGPHSTSGRRASRGCPTGR